MINKNVPCFGVYLICINKNDKNLLEIYHNIELFKPFNKNKDLVIIGMADGRTEAFGLVRTIINDYYDKNKTLDGFKLNIL